MAVSSGLKQSQRVSKCVENLGAEHIRESQAVSRCHETLGAQRIHASHKVTKCHATLVAGPSRASRRVSTAPKPSAPSASTGLKVSKCHATLGAEPIHAPHRVSQCCVRSGWHCFLERDRMAQSALKQSLSRVPALIALMHSLTCMPRLLPAPSVAACFAPRQASGYPPHGRLRTTPLLAGRLHLVALQDLGGPLPELRHREHLLVAVIILLSQSQVSAQPRPRRLDRVSGRRNSEGNAPT